MHFDLQIQSTYEQLGLRSAFNNVPAVNRKASCEAAKMVCHTKSCKEKPRRESPPFYPMNYFVLLEIFSYLLLEFIVST
jgi:hypothetical protein